MSDDVRTGNWRLFAPTLDDSGLAYAALLQAAVLPPDDALRELSNKLEFPLPGTSSIALQLRAATLVLRDLISMGWQTMASGGWIYVRPLPPGNFSKEAARRQLEFGRNDQLNEPSTRKFILGLERPTRQSSCKPVTDLIADGRAMANDLRKISGLKREERGAALAAVCQPYLQLVTSDARDDFTGQRLMDVWRYFRHTWATRYRATPGRNLFYLIRDAARPNHPVMGITALGNAVMQLTPRDDAIGWTIEGLQAALRTGIVQDSEVLEAFRRRIEGDYAEIYKEDFGAPASPAEPFGEDVLERLETIERNAAGKRADGLRDPRDDESVAERVDDVSTVDLERLAKSPLFVAKRARLVRDLLKTYRELNKHHSVVTMLTNSIGQWAISQVLRQCKKQFSATSMMEITVCGAIAPYNHLLGGKLACLMMLSPQVRRDYSERYRDTYSIIASQMAGRPVGKTPCLAFLGTSSLYPGRSSQYNRVSLPEGTCEGQSATIHYRELGSSEGYGSPNLSSETEAALEFLAGSMRTYRNVNFVFGEGQSPKLRQLREGFALLGLNRSNVLNHGTRRLVYGIDLVENLSRYLLGVDAEARFCIPDSAEADTQIADFWRERWLAGRLDYAPALDRVATSTPLTERVSRLMPDREIRGQPDLLRFSGKEERPMAPAVEDEKLAFVRQLYRDESAYSDHVKLARLRDLNVRTNLEKVVQRIVRGGGSVVITGNAGDGKTHTIRLLESDLKSAKAKVIIDASAESQDDIIRQWTEARSEGLPFCIAINEGPLVELIRSQAHKAPWLNAVRDQLHNLVTYRPIDEVVDDRYTPIAGETVVIDLSLRRILASDIVTRVIEKLTDDMWYESCAACPQAATCPVTANRTMLRDAQVKQRCVELLGRVGERGVRATFRELLGFVSYMIFGGKTCAELIAEGQTEFNRYSWLAFEGQGVIFEQLEAGLDPYRQTDAKIDESLWAGQFEPAEFVGHDRSPLLARNLDQVREKDERQATDAYTALKRRWYFEHPSGKLRYATQADRLFAELQDLQRASQLRVGRLIALINGWWNTADKYEQDQLRLWTRLAYSPRAHGRAMVSGRQVSGLMLHLFKPVLSPPLRQAFGIQAIDHVLLAHPENIRFANLVVDRRLLLHLLSAGAAEAVDDLERRLGRFNDALSQHAANGSHVRTIEMLDPESELHVTVRVDLSQRRYDSAQ